MPEFIKDLASYNKIKADTKTLLVIDFTASWCGPCKMISPEFAKLADQHKEVAFYKVDVDENADAAEAENVSAMPTFKFFKGGKLVDEVVGANLKDLTDKVAKHK